MDSKIGMRGKTMQVIYLDLLFILNVIMNYFIFKIVVRVSNRTIKAYRIIVAAMISSGFYCLGIMLPVLRQLPQQIYQLFIPIVAVLYLFRCITIRTFLKKLILTYLVAWGVGGLAFNLYYMGLNVTGNKTIAWWIPIVSGAVLLIVVEVGYTWIRRSMIEPRYSYNLEVINNHHQVEIQGYLDTGNCLYTLNHYPVIIGEYEMIYPVINECYRNLLEECRRGSIEGCLSSYTPMPKIYLIPFTSVGCKENLMIGIPIEKIKVATPGTPKVIEGGVIGVCFEKLFSDRRYQALIHPDLLL